MPNLKSRLEVITGSNRPLNHLLRCGCMNHSHPADRDRRESSSGDVLNPSWPYVQYYSSMEDRQIFKVVPL